MNIYTKKPIGWIKEANKLGKYKTTYKGFRIYTVKEVTCIQDVVQREGQMYSRTSFTKGDYVAVDRYGVTYKGWYWNIIAKIDVDF